MERINACSFDPELKNLAVLTLDNKLRVYDIDLKRLRVECVEKDSLANCYNCLSWINSDEIAVGCNNGEILIFDLLNAEVKTRMKSTTDGPVISLWWVNSKKQLISNTASGNVSAWDISTQKITNQIRVGKESNALAITSDDSFLFTGSFNIKAISTKTGEQVNKFAGRHSAPIVKLVTARPSSKGISSRAVLSCSATERQMYLWVSDLKDDVTITPSKMKFMSATEPLQCFVADAAIVAADVIVIDDDVIGSNDDTTKTYGILAVTISGIVNIWKWKHNTRRKRSAPEKPHVRITSENAKKTPIFNASFCEGTNGTTVMTSRGASTLLPRFDSTVISYEKYSPNSSEKIVYTLPGIDDSVLKSQSDDSSSLTSKKKKTANDVNVLAPHEAGALNLTKVNDVIDNQNVTSSSSSSSSSSSGSGAELTLAERVASEDAISGSIRGNSMHSVLMQAIRTNDQTLLDTVLYSRTASEQSTTVLSNTVRNLPPQYVVPLLNLLVDKFKYSPAHGLILVQWVKVILTEHLSYLMTIPNIVSSLSGLYLMINSRTESHKTLLKLSGRLDLVLAQVAKAQMASEAAPPMNIIAEDEEDGDPKFVALGDDEDDDSDEEDEDDMEQVTGESALVNEDDDEDEEEDEDDENENVEVMDEDEDMDEE